MQVEVMNRNVSWTIKPTKYCINNVTISYPSAFFNCLQTSFRSQQKKIVFLWPFPFYFEVGTNETANTRLPQEAHKWKHHKERFYISDIAKGKNLGRKLLGFCNVLILIQVALWSSRRDSKLKGQMKGFKAMKDTKHIPNQGFTVSFALPTHFPKYDR